MAKLLVHTQSSAFGEHLQQLITQASWTRFDIAVAWVRRSGTKHLMPVLYEFLRRGGQLQVIVGIDIENTSIEGLQDLVALTMAFPASARVLVRHNESPESTFHPKLYLLSDSSTFAKLIVGSNNITEAGLFMNDEASLEMDLSSNDPLLRQVRSTLAEWANVRRGLVRVLGAAALQELVDHGYVRSEAHLQRRSRASESERDRVHRDKPKLFRKSRRRAPDPPPSIHIELPEVILPAPSEAVSAVVSPARVSSGLIPPRVLTGRRVFFRPRLSRGTQAQMPDELWNTEFFGKRRIRQARSVRDNALRGINPARSGGADNTRKLELRETKGMIEPVVLFIKTPTGIDFEVFDAVRDPIGLYIFHQLQAGFATGDTEQTISDRAHATWWRIY